MLAPPPRAILPLLVASLIACTPGAPSSAVPRHDAPLPLVLEPSATEPAAQTRSEAEPEVAQAAPETPPTTAPATGIAALGRVFDATFDSDPKWITIDVPIADEKQGDRMIRALDKKDPPRLWKGHWEIPRDVVDLPPLYLVSTTGVQALEGFWWVGHGSMYGDAGVAFRRGTAHYPGLVLSTQPPEGARTTAAVKSKRAKRTHAMVDLFRRVLSEDDRALVQAVEKRRSVRFVVQVTPGRFPGADRIVAVTAVDVEEEAPYDLSALFTIDAEGEPVQVILNGSGMALEVTTTVDLDGDGIDEFVVSGRAFEEASVDLHRFCDGGTEHVTLYEHAV